MVHSIMTRTFVVIRNINCKQFILATWLLSRGTYKKVKCRGAEV